MFFIVPQGINQLPGGSAAVISFGLLFFFLLLIAGLTSSISLVEAFTSAVRDKFHVSRKRVLVWMGSIGVVGSAIFALPLVVDKGLADNGTMGLTLLDIFSHWNFSYGLLIVGLLECIVVGWIMGADKLRLALNEHSKIKLGVWFDYLIKYIIPLLLVVLLGWAFVDEIRNGLYGSSFSKNYSEDFQFMKAAPVAILVIWLLGAGIAAWIFTKKGSFDGSE